MKKIGLCFVFLCLLISCSYKATPPDTANSNGRSNTIDKFINASTAQNTTSPNIPEISIDYTLYSTTEYNSVVGNGDTLVWANAKEIFLQNGRSTSPESIYKIDKALHGKWLISLSAYDKSILIWLEYCMPGQGEKANSELRWMNIDDRKINILTINNNQEFDAGLSNGLIVYQNLPATQSDSNLRGSILVFDTTTNKIIKIISDANLSYSQPSISDGKIVFVSSKTANTGGRPTEIMLYDLGKDTFQILDSQNVGHKDNLSICGDYVIYDLQDPDHGQLYLYNLKTSKSERIWPDADHKNDSTWLGRINREYVLFHSDGLKQILLFNIMQRKLYRLQGDVGFNLIKEVPGNILWTGKSADSNQYFLKVTKTF